MKIKVELNKGYNARDSLIIERFLEEKRKRSLNSYIANRCYLFEFLNFVNKNLENIQIDDGISFFERINKDYRAFSTKRDIRTRLKSFFNYYESVNIRTIRNYKNPIPESHIFEFSKKETDYNLTEFDENVIFTDEQLLFVLGTAKKRRLMEFIIFLLLICSAPRMNELLTIKLTNLNLEKRYFITGITYNARKQNKPLLFFFPEKISGYLKLYISQLDHDSIWLFPSRNNRNKEGYYKYIGIYLTVINNYGKEYSHFHEYRSTLITNRIKRMSCPEGYSEGLANHAGKSTEWKHYIKLSNKEKLEIYDKYFPYYRFPYF